MYGFRFLLKKRAAEYKKIIGEEVDSMKLHEILWNVMDPDTKLTASRQGVHTKSYKALTEHIDERYKMTFGLVGLHDKKDDPMGFVSLLGTDDSDKSPAATTSSNTSHQQSEYDQHLDAFGKGTGKGGWMANGGNATSVTERGTWLAIAHRR